MRFSSLFVISFLFLKGLCINVPFPAARYEHEMEGSDKLIYEEVTARNMDMAGLMELDFSFFSTDRCGYADPYSVMGRGIQLWMQWKEKKERNVICSILYQLLSFLPIIQCNTTTMEGVGLMDMVEFPESNTWNVLLVDHTVTLSLSQMFPLTWSDDVLFHIHYSSHILSKSLYTCRNQADRLPVSLFFPDRHGYHNRLHIPVREELKNTTLFLSFPRGSYFDVDELAELFRLKELPPFRSFPISIDCELSYADSHISFLLLSVPLNQSSPIIVPFHLRVVLPRDVNTTQSNLIIRLPSITVLNPAKGYRRLPIFSEEITLSIPVGNSQSPTFVLVFTLLTVAISTWYLLVSFLQYSSHLCAYGYLLKTE